MSRGFKINRQSGMNEKETNLVDWLSDFVEAQAKSEKSETAVDAARKRNSQSYLQQIVNIIGNPPRYATVEDAVQDMRERTGLNAYLDKMKTADNGESKKKVNKSASEKCVLPESLSKYKDVAEDIENFVQNNINNTHGLASTVPQLQYDILSVFGLRYGIESQDVMNHEVAKYLNDCILEAQKNLNSSNKIPASIGDGVGRVDVDDYDDQDAWSGFMPAGK